MKKIYTIILTLLFVIITIAPLTLAEQKNPETIDIDFVKDKKGVVHFQHKKHNTDRKIECKECHHKLEKGKDIDPCRKCHGKKKDGDKPEAKEAFHKNCKKDCHEKDKEKKAPTKCEGCHGKEEKK